MNNQDESKLGKEINEKHGVMENKIPKTQNMCKYFLEFIENNYGQFQVYPGDDNYKCCYALLPEFTFEKRKKKIS